MRSRNLREFDLIIELSLARLIKMLVIEMLYAPLYYCIITIMLVNVERLATGYSAFDDLE